MASEDEDAPSENEDAISEDEDATSQDIYATSEGEYGFETLADRLLEFTYRDVLLLHDRSEP